MPQRRTKWLASVFLFYLYNACWLWTVFVFPNGFKKKSQTLAGSCRLNGFRRKYICFEMKLHSFGSDQNITVWKTEIRGFGRTLICKKQPLDKCVSVCVRATCVCVCVRANPLINHCCVWTGGPGSLRFSTLKDFTSPGGECLLPVQTLTNCVHYLSPPLLPCLLPLQSVS